MLRITNYRQGAILNRKHGMEKAKSLKVRSEGLCCGHPVMSTKYCPFMNAGTLLSNKKIIILWLGVILYFLTTMSRVLVPATIFEDLLALGTLSTAQIAALGSSLWYAYAASQLLAGLFSDRYGGVRILLIGGSVFSVGMIGFPWLDNFYLMLVFRILTGLGAGTVFLGVSKLIADVYSEKFSMVMSVVLFIAFLGAPCGTAPMTALVKAIGWRWAMLTPGLIALAVLAGIAALAPGNIQPTRRGNALVPFRKMLQNGKMWCLCIYSSVMFSGYYMILTLVGRKSLSDFFGMTTIHAAQVMMGLTFFAAVMTLDAGFLLRLFGNRRKLTSFAGGVCTLAGALIGFLAFHGKGGLGLVIAAYVLLTFPGGFFPIFSTITKELNPPEDTGLAVAVLNFSATLCIALFQHFGGVILNCFEPVDQVFPPEAYRALFGTLTLIVLASLLGLFGIPETGKSQS